MALLPTALSSGSWTMLAGCSAARTCPRAVAGRRTVRVLRVLTQLFGQLFDLTGQLADELNQFGELGIALRELGVALREARLQRFDAARKLLLFLCLIADRHTTLRSRSDPHVDPLGAGKVGGLNGYREIPKRATAFFAKEGTS